MRGGAVR
jgi:hypothetical protein